MKEGHDRHALRLLHKLPREHRDDLVLALEMIIGIAQSSSRKLKRIRRPQAKGRIPVDPGLLADYEGDGTWTTGEAHER